ncbi:MAG: VIT and VWA domain-containing protein [Methanoregula sp.]
MIFNTRWFENSRPDGIAVLEIVDSAGTGFVPLRKTTLEGTVTGPLGDFTITHIFRYSRETNPRVIEALYRFPLPGDAAVTGADVSFGNVTISSVLKVRDTAESEYRNAKKENRAAALVTRESPDVFTLRIAGICPDQDVTIKTRYVHIGTPDQSGFSFRVPLTTAPRYVRGDERYSRHANGQPLFVLRDPGHRFSLAVSPGAEGVLTCRTHHVSTGADGHVTLGEIVPDRDCVLVWEPARPETRPACRVFSDGAEETHFLALVSPPEQAPARYPREVIILVDHSGSMEGAKWEAADWAVERFISGLTGRDNFNLCLFESRSSWFSRKPLPAGEENKQRAIDFLKDKKSGGTELGMALEQALSQQRVTGLLSRNVIIITDGAVSDGGRILRMADTESRLPDARRISLLCIDSAPNSNLVRQVAERGSGIAKFLSSSPEEEDITSALDDVLALWDSPVAVGLSLAVNRDNLLVDRRKVRLGPDGRCHIDLGDLPSGKSTWVVVRAPPGPEPLQFELCRPDADPLSVPVTLAPSVSALFGARLIAELEYLMHADLPENELLQNLAGLGYDTVSGSSPSKVYAENRMQEGMNRVRDLVVRESLRYSVLSAETAFVAVRSEPGRPVEEEVLVPNALPDGWSGSFAKAVFLPKMSPRRASGQPSGGSCLEWDCGGGKTFIGQPDGTMKLEQRRVTRMAGKPGSVILPDTTFSPSPAATPVRKPESCTLYSGRPVFVNQECVLFDSSRDEDARKIPEEILVKKLEIALNNTRVFPATGLFLLLYMGDAAVPRVKVLVSDLLLHGGVRPLNLRRGKGDLVRLVLIDPEGGWEESSPDLKVIVR